MIITLHYVACDEGGCSNTGPQAHTKDYARADAQTVGWDISEDGDWCPAHSREHRAAERADGEREHAIDGPHYDTVGHEQDGCVWDVPHCGPCWPPGEPKPANPWARADGSGDDG